MHIIRVSLNRVKKHLSIKVESISNTTTIGIYPRNSGVIRLKITNSKYGEWCLIQVKLS